MYLKHPSCWHKLFISLLVSSIIIRNWFGRELSFVRNPNTVSVARYQEALDAISWEAGFEGTPLEVMA